MLDKVIIKVKCPYCNIETKQFVPFHEITNLEIANCDEEEGGCGSNFVMEYKFQPIMITKRIEGEDKKNF